MSWDGFFYMLYCKKIQDLSSHASVPFLLFCCRDDGWCLVVWYGAGRFGNNTSKHLRVFTHIFVNVTPHIFSHFPAWAISFPANFCDAFLTRRGKANNSLQINSFAGACHQVAWILFYANKHIDGASARGEREYRMRLDVSFISTKQS